MASSWSGTEMLEVLMEFRKRAAVVLGLSTLLWGSFAYAQCTKDIDCKGDRVCRSGVCEDPHPATPANPTGVDQPSAPAMAPSAEGSRMNPGDCVRYPATPALRVLYRSTRGSATTATRTEAMAGTPRAIGRQVLYSTSGGSSMPPDPRGTVILASARR